MAECEFIGCKAKATGVLTHKERFWNAFTQEKRVCDKCAKHWLSKSFTSTWEAITFCEWRARRVMRELEKPQP